MTTNLQTDPSLLKALRKAATRKLSQEELRRQRISYIMGSVGHESNITRAQVEEVLKAHEGEKSR